MVRLSEGDLSAFRRVYELAWSAVVQCIACATADAALAEDIAQEAFIKVWHARHTFERGAQVLPWIRTIARRTLIDSLRRRQLERDALQKSRDLIVCENDTMDSRFEEVLDARRASRAIAASMDRLPPKQAQAIALLATEGGDLTQLAERIGDTPLALRLRLHRARATLKKTLASQAFDRRLTEPFDRRSIEAPSTIRSCGRVAHGAETPKRAGSGVYTKTSVRVAPMRRSVATGSAAVGAHL